MTDVHKPEIRSYNMSQIRGKNTNPELLVRKFLHSNGFRYRIHVKGLPGTPDLVLKKYYTIINIHGCFWHGHSGCKYFKIPTTRTEWWLNKINRTKELDSNNIESLKKMGWQVIEIWECDLKPDKIRNTLENLLELFNRK